MYPRQQQILRQEDPAQKNPNPGNRQPAMKSRVTARAIPGVMKSKVYGQLAWLL
jgi:hypothetical protein